MSGGRRRIAGLVGSALAVGTLSAAGPTPGTAAAVRAAPTVTATPSTGLVDFQLIRVTGSGFPPAPLMEIFECRGGATSEVDCDGYNADFVDSDGNGNVVYDFRVDARIYLPSGEAVDCRTDPAGCEIGIGFMLDADEWPEVALEFDPDAPLRPPVTASVRPSTGLVDGQVVIVHGENLSPREEAFAYLCAVGTTMPGTRCDLDRAVSSVPDPDGSIDLHLDVRPQFPTPLAGSIDCLNPPGGCEVVLSWGFSGPPDRVDQVPVSFAGAPPPPPPPSPPAPPAPGTPTFTG
jgi:Neocarzinostatin family